MTTVAVGHQAEVMVSEFLQRRGCQILAQNWRTRYCEIDIVAKRAGTVYVMEVKYRSSNRQGSGMDYITPPKLRQMRFAAELWVQANRWRGSYQLMAFEVTGADFSRGRLMLL